MEIPGWTIKWKINNFLEGGKRREIKKEEVIDTLQSGVSLVGEEKLGIEADDVKSHCMRTSFALWMAMLREPDYLIMLLWMWKSDKFMDYIRHQILQFTEDVANKMVGINEYKFIILHIR